MIEITENELLKNFDEIMERVIQEKKVYLIDTRVILAPINPEHAQILKQHAPKE